MNLVELISALRTAGFSVEAEELADILWLANQLPVPQQRQDSPKAAEPPLPSAGRDDKGGKLDAPPPPPPLPPDPQPSTSHKESPTPAGVYLPSGADRKDGLSFRSAGVSALPDKLSYARALRPLLRRVPSAHHSELDEEATVHRIADTQEWLPVMRPTLSHWLELDIVVDEWSSMVLWRESIHELITLLTNLGAFRSVQVWSLWIAQDGKTVELHSGWGSPAQKGPARAPKELISVRGNRLVLLLSDVVSPAWYNGTVAQLLRQWIHSEIVMLFHLLPYEYWQRTGLINAIPAYFRSSSPGRPNAQLTAMPAEAGRKKLPKSGFLPLPTLPFDAHLVANWAQAIARRNNLWMPGVLLPLDDSHEQTRQAQIKAKRDLNPAPTAVDEYTAAMTMVERFRAAASPEAWKLAGYFSATVPLSLPLMRLVQRVMLPKASREHLAEFYLSGLIRREKGSAFSSDEETRYVFAPGVRRVLFSSITRSEAAEVIRRTSRFISRESGKVIDFNALLADPALATQIDLGSMPFAELSQSLLRVLGGEYAVLADALSGKFVLVEVDGVDQIDKTIPKSSFTQEPQHTPEISEPIETKAPEQAQLPRLSIPSNITLNISEMQLMQHAHAGYSNIIIEKEFGGGYAAMRLFLILPVKQNGERNTRVVTKIGSAYDLQREKIDYDFFVRPELPFTATKATGYYSLGDQAAINYTFAGGGTLGEIMSLEDYYLTQPAETINQTLNVLFDKTLGETWYVRHQPYTVLFRYEYGRHLPPHEELAKIVSAIYSNLLTADGKRVQISGIAETYPDPLLVYPKVLDRSLRTRKSLVHGDLHLRNVLVDETGKAWLIDFSKVKERHNLFDFIKLETYIRLTVLSQIAGAFSLNDYAQFELALNDSSTPPNNPELAKAYEVIQNIREIARKYMGSNPDFKNEYFPALFLYALSMLKYYSVNGTVPTQLIYMTSCVLAQNFSKEGQKLPEKTKESPIPMNELIPEIWVDGYLNIKTHMGQCCMPNSGDQIIGYLTRNRTATIHRVDCTSMIRQIVKEPERLLKVSWSDTLTNENLVLLDSNKLNNDVKRKLVNTLLECQSLISIDSRKHIIGKLPYDIRSNISLQNGSNKIDIGQLLNTCLQYIGGIEKLVESIDSVEGHSVQVRKLRQLISIAKGNDLDSEFLKHSEKSYAFVLSDLAQLVPEKKLEQLLIMARNIRNEEIRASVLSDLAKRLPELAEEAMATIRMISNEEIRTRLLDNLTQYLPFEIAQTASIDVKLVLEQLIHIINRLLIGDLEVYSSKELAETIDLLQDIRNVSAHTSSLSALLEPLSLAIAHLSAAREFAIPKTNRNVEYYKNMRSARNVFKQIKQIISAL